MHKNFKFKTIIIFVDCPGTADNIKRFRTSKCMGKRNNKPIIGMGLSLGLGGNFGVNTQCLRSRFRFPLVVTPFL